MTPDLRTMTLEQKAELARALLLDFEDHFKGHPIIRGMIGRLHARADTLRQALVDNGDVSALSVGGDKPEHP